MGELKLRRACEEFLEVLVLDHEDARCPTCYGKWHESKEKFIHDRWCPVLEITQALSEGK